MARSQSTLYANELVADVGGTCWDRNEPLAIVDHHFSRDGHIPRLRLAVLHKAKLIREKFASQQNNVLWLVTHQQPDFDAFCSLVFGAVGRGRHGCGNRLGAVRFAS